MARLFGTDGIRGIANKELTCELAINIGRAAALILTDKTNRSPKIIIGKDTRLSSDMLESAIAAGICSIGANAVLLGVVPTPAVAFLVGKYKADAGIMISASHNTYEFNGIKIFNGDGYKLPDELEDRIEAIVQSSQVDFPTGSSLGCVSTVEVAAQDYINHIKSTVPFALDGLHIALDCANGSASRTAQTLFSQLGAKCHVLSCEPNGANINQNCGSTHLENLTQYVKSHKLDAGIAFDGDADRCLAVDETGEIIDGDFLMAICAADMKLRGKLSKNTVVGTIMSNIGFHKFCKDQDINFISTKVGDRYVLEDMLREEYNLGGEQSGHVIFLDFATTGDGQLTAAQLLSILKRRNVKLSSLAGIMSKYPQVTINVDVSDEGKVRFYTDHEIKRIIDLAKEQLGEKGRIVVRPSGTEPLVRVMVECEDAALTSSICKEVADIIKAHLSID